MSVLRICFVIIIGILVDNVWSRPNWIDNEISEEFKYDWKETEKKSCGYESCPKPKDGMINVHIVPHSHDDVGWLKTLDQYYYGSRTYLQKAGVQYILDSVVQELFDYPDRRFVYVESAFFFKWWNEKSDNLKQRVYQLVQEGRLEFIGGAWSMNDEGNVHYQSVIDQFTLGLRKLNDTFGECGRPKIGWQIDPFGHSREMASLLAQMKFDGLFFARIDYADKSNRLNNLKAEFIWEGSPNLGEKSDIFTSLLYNHYSPPPGFCFDVLCSDDPIIDGQRAPDNNVDMKVDAFSTFINTMARKYKTNNVLITMGDDFHYQSAGMWYTNLDKLITYTNQRQESGANINLFYSTPSCYVKAVYDANQTWSTKSDDLFPYSSDPHAFWTGYFTSRPNLKRFERTSNNFLQVCKQLSALSPNPSYNFDYNLTPLKEAMGVMQHHDAITGTEKQHVAEDYARLLFEGVKMCEANIEVALNELSSNDMSAKSPHILDVKPCHNLNISQCDVSENAEIFIATIYNPLAHSRYEHVRIPVPEGEYFVRDEHGYEIVSQLVPISVQIQNLHYRSSKAVNELVFTASNLPPLGFRSYYVNKIVTEPIPEQNKIFMSKEVEDDELLIIGNQFVYATFDKTGHLVEVSGNGAATNFSQNFYYYEAAIGDNSETSKRASGAYIFRPNGTEKLISQNIKIETYIGPIVEEVHQIFSDWVSQVVRIYKDDKHIEFDWVVGPIPDDDSIGREVISRFSADIASNGFFETDANGREMLKRKRNHRESWDIDLQEPVAGNYYPVASKIAIEDNVMRMSILNDRAQGGSSLEDGDIELMIHRRLLYDDSFGVSEPLNEYAFGKGIIARGQHYLMVGAVEHEIPSVKALERTLQLEILQPSLIFFSNADGYTFEDWQNGHVNSFSGLSEPLPPNVHLLTFEPLSDGNILIRFEHILEKDEDEKLSKPILINLKNIFRTLNIRAIHETTLAGNQWLDETNRLQFKKDKKSFNTLDAQYSNKFETFDIGDDIISLGPMQIRTFVVVLNRSK